MEIKDLETKIDVRINLTNVNEFRKLISEFNKKAHELNLIAHELETFTFEGKLEQSILSDYSN
ncbi:hypothetical protein VWV84_08305 [Streptococcus agalactiae]|uniref:hypothetical protein n=1 Tax=Streptococcus agalactiae TaxID=1311 RepID=UPI0003039B4F|nr:hypothetical protein [Streptococcus agalactiae]EPW72005.1 hypothetical protein SAG0101_02575 [Streptococcus agalactiae BSU451]QBX23515.1 hypothetical protein Javan14_0013 [Streptococcus phage Javan14]